MLERAGLRPSDVLSKRSRAYRALGLGNKRLSEDELLDLMIQEPTLLRRPLVLGSSGSVVGYNQKQLHKIVDADGDDE